MKLVLSIVNCPVGCNMEGQQYQFGVEGGTFGRAPDNTWVLPDPSRYVSSKHCEIKYDGQQFILNDCSTNGTYLNDAPQPVGLLSQPALKTGDALQFGDYRIQVNVEAVVATNEPAQAAVADPNATQMSSPQSSGAPSNALDDLDKWLEPAAPAQENKIEAQPIMSSAPVSSTPGIGVDLGLGGEEKDPLAALGATPPSSTPAPQPSGALSDLVQDTPPLDQQMMRVPHAIPDDWDDLLGGGSESSQAEAPIPQSAPPVTPPSEPAPATLAPQAAPVDPNATTFITDNAHAVDSSQAMGSSQPAPASSSDDQALDAFLGAPSPAAPPVEEPKPIPQQTAVQSAAPVPPQPSAPAVGGVSVDAQSLANELGLQLSEAQLANLNSVVASTVKAMVGGMMQTLRARSEIKSEFRMNMTTIQSAENNPLKFSVTPDDALENMFAKTGKAYLSPEESVADGFADIADHQLALFEAMRAAYDNILNQFDPTTLEAKFENTKGKGLLSGGKGKNWDLFGALFDEYKQDTEATFKRLFGEVFADAYERRMHSLKMNRKK